ncbi:MAG: UDP-3-O-[3-hydroxymyristoyl] N-acetylglucosamine deacetylase [Planctomycetota bacterium]|nr:MAG: UDP-3-O-[3-hydroxymyristoyl] N-acetylglucosamine deacetylase [Planctomycetota bacterium]
MHALRKQRTIARPVSVFGFGFWSGRDVRLEFRAAEPDTGIVFVRTDLGHTRIPAVVANRIETPRRTTLTAGRASVEMVEHVMAALAGMQIDNCEVWVDEAEMPGCDGSSLPFVQALREAGAVDQDALRARLIVRNVTRLGTDDAWVEARPNNHSGLSVKFRLDYGSGNAIGRQTLQLAVSPDSFERELAPSRTFVLAAEADWLISRGLGRRATYQNVLVFDNDGPVENTLRYRDECVRHKALDLVGDLALAGCDLHGHFIAHRSGHRLNAELVRALLVEEEIVEGRRRSA